MVSWINASILLGKAISRGMSPRVASMYQVPLDFSVDLRLKFTQDFSDKVANTKGIAGIQSVKIDNSLNSDVLIILFDNGETITCPAYSMGIFPVFFSGDTLSFEAISAVAVKCQLTFINTREQAQIWVAKYPVAGTFNVTGSTVFNQPTQGTFSKSSLDLTTGGTSQQIMAANANRRILAIRNPGTVAGQNIAAPEPVYISFGAGAAVAALNTWELLPGEQLPQWLATTTESVWVNAATTGHRITAYQI